MISDPGQLGSTAPAAVFEADPPAAYPPGDLADGWEFKIIRSRLGLFADRAFRGRILGEEARAGWTLLEMIDEHRIRLKRLGKSVPDSELDEIDPYRIEVDRRERTSRSRRENRLAWLAIVVIPPVVALIISAFRGRP